MAVRGSDVTFAPRSPGAQHLDCRGSSWDFIKNFAGKLDRRGSQVLVQAPHFSRARNRRNPRLLGQQPGERDLCRCRIYLERDTFEQIDERLVGLESLGRKAREDASNTHSMPQTISKWKCFIEPFQAVKNLVLA